MTEREHDLKQKLSRLMRLLWGQKQLAKEGKPTLTQEQLYRQAKDIVTVKKDDPEHVPYTETNG